MNDIQLLIKASPIVLVFLACSCLGKALKATPRVPDWLIPWVLPVFGAAVYVGVGALVPIPGIDHLQHPSILYGLIGFCCGGMAVWKHQLIKQFQDK